MGDFGRGIAEAFVVLLWVCAVSVPLGIWKIIDIILWAAGHVRVSLT